uniref:Cyan fluorescent GFP-like protein n=1 Tax=Eusmilia fastigiata TaxID=214972 RepID=A8CLW9_9CNID|nr:cyan fluorescent GFP-like protein [Eusmilia fastigiata]
MSFSKQVLNDVTMTYFMEGSVNGHDFTIEGEGTGKPYEGHQRFNLRVTKGAPLPFAVDILSAAFAYGNRCFTKYPKEIPDFFKQSLPEDMSWERTMTFEDGGIVAISAHIRLIGNRFEHKSKFVGVNFPADGPVMQRKTLGWEPSSEKMTPRDGILKGYVPSFLVLQGGGNYRCDYDTSYRAMKPVEMPGGHFIQHRIVRRDIKKDSNGNTWQIQEDAFAHNSEVPDSA